MPSSTKIHKLALNLNKQVMLQRKV